ncbi:multicopper oxidase-domain-containing protein [Rhodocollybia butyracea]|uniref:laccase n=1 Tax=Rhodocollybia butyracea TaxID=206335 RepID=A0A9P5PE94_9AGAR|nr:multicopper oxidase-domain-containing protein [Rhodocollybia butyracea]
MELFWRYTLVLALVLLLLRSLPLDLAVRRLQSLIFPSYEVSRFHLAPSRHSLRPATVKVFNFTLTDEVLSPNGVSKRVFTINGLFPGPTIEVRSGDLLVVNVYNRLSEATSLHWHGIRHQPGQNSQDGASGVTQCPIPAGSNYTYRIQISQEQSGTFWYHSHHSTHRADGLFGALVIHPPIQEEHRDELRGLRYYRRDTKSSEVWDQIMLIGDWYHRQASEVQDWFQSRRSHGNEPVPDAILNNGQQAFNCSKSVAKVICDPKKGRTPAFMLHPQHRNIIRFINTGSVAEIHLSLDSHLLHVVEADGTLVQPVVVKELTIAPGQRYVVEVIYTGDAPNTSQNFWLRQRVNFQDFKYPNPALDLESKSIITYGYRADSSLPSSPRWPSIKEDERLNALTLRPLDPSAHILPPADDVVMMYITTMIRGSTGNKPFSYVNQTTWKPNLTNPVLARIDVASSLKELIVPVRTTNTSTAKSEVVLDIIVNNLEDGPHPLHLHGHHFWPLYTYEAPMGAGSYKWDRPPALPIVAPALRDTFVVPAKGHAIFRVKFDTPGAWLFHCHVLVHLQSGMGLIFDVLNDLISTEDRTKAADSCLAL